MNPLDWYKKRQAMQMPMHAELMLNLIDAEPAMPIMYFVHKGINLGIGSSTTVHGGIKWLKAHDFIRIKVDDKDSRCKICTLTPKGSTYLGAKT